MKWMLTACFFTCAVNLLAQNETDYNRVFDSLTRLGKRNDAIRFFTAEEKKFPQNERIQRSLGALYFELNDFSKSDEHYTKAVKINPNCGICYFYLAQVAAQGSDLIKAQHYIAKGLEVAPDEAYLYTLRGKIKISTQDEISGLNDLDKAIRLAPKDPIVYYERANYFLGKQNYFSAKRDFLKVIALDSTNIQTYNLLAQIAAYQSDFDQALGYINNALKINAQHVLSLKTRGGVYSMAGDHVHALEDFKSVTRMDSSDYEVHYHLADEYYSLEQMDDFCAEISRSIALMEDQHLTSDEFYSFQISKRTAVCDSSKSSYYFQRGIALFNVGKLEASIVLYDRGITKFPEESMIYSFRGNSEFRMKQWDKAIDDYLTSIRFSQRILEEYKVHPSFSRMTRDSLELMNKGFMASTHLSLALCYFNQQQFEIALQHIDLAIGSIPNLPDFSAQEFLRMRGLILLQLNRQPEALDLFKALVKQVEVNSSDAAFLAVLEFNTACGATVVFQPVDLFSASELYTVQWNFPKKLKTKNKDYLLQSKEHIEMAIRLDETNAMAYYMRGKINAQLGRDNCCADFLWASKLGYPVELEWMKACAN